MPTWCGDMGHGGHIPSQPLAMEGSGRAWEKAQLFSQNLWSKPNQINGQGKRRVFLHSLARH